MRKAPLFVLLAAGLVSGCKGKVEQCNAFVDEANSGQSAYVGLEAIASNADALGKRADALDAAGKRVRAVKLSDEKLADMRDRWASFGDQYGAGLRKLAAAPKDDPAAVDAIEKDLDQTADGQQKLIAEVNAYCGAR